MFLQLHFTNLYTFINLLLCAQNPETSQQRTKANPSGNRLNWGRGERTAIHGVGIRKSVLECCGWFLLFSCNSSCTKALAVWGVAVGWPLGEGRHCGECWRVNTIFTERRAAQSCGRGQEVQGNGGRELSSLKHHVSESVCSR